MQQSHLFFLCFSSSLQMHSSSSNTLKHPISPSSSHTSALLKMYQQQEKWQPWLAVGRKIPWWVWRESFAGNSSSARQQSGPEQEATAPCPDLQHSDLIPKSKQNRPQEEETSKSASREAAKLLNKGFVFLYLVSFWTLFNFSPFSFC
jgi:hypothetical protein